MVLHRHLLVRRISVLPLRARTEDSPNRRLRVAATASRFQTGLGQEREI
jgi:hypothetical protein